MRRQRLHHQIAQALEQVYAAHLEEHTLEIAHHLIRAGPIAAQPKVMMYARQAGDQACLAFAWGEAARYYEAALATDQLTPHAQAVLHYRAGLAYHRDQDVGPCLQHYYQAIAGYRMANDVQGLAHVLMQQTELQYSLVSVPLGSLPDVSPLEEVLEALGDSAPGLRGNILNIMALAYRHAQQTVIAQRMATHALKIGRYLQADDLCARANNTLAQIQIHNLQVRESVESYQHAFTAAQRLGDSWLQGLPLQRLPLSYILLGQLDAAETAALDACHLAQTTQDWGNYSLPLAHLTYIQVARGDFPAAQRYAQESLRMARRSGYPWGSIRALLAQACMYTLQGAWTEAEQQLDWLIEPGRLLSEPGVVMQRLVEVLRRLIRAYAGSVDEETTSLVLALQQDVEIDIYMLAPYCALVELSDLLAAPALAERAFQVLERIVAHGVYFTPEWVFLIPRVLGIAAMGRRDWDKAETYFHTAVATASRMQTQPELGRAYVDYARMLVARNRAHDRLQAYELLAQAEPICQTLGMQPCVQHIRQLRMTLEAPTSPGRPHQWKAAGLLRPQRSSSFLT